MVQSKNTKPVNNKRNGIIILCIVIIICIIGFSRSYFIKRKGICTIATVYNIEKAREGHSFNFSYLFKGVKYENYGFASYVYKNDNGMRFFIYILEDNPTEFQMTDIRVPDSITEAPYEGWKELPIQVQE